MTDQVYTIGYEFEPSRYSPHFGYSQLRTVISSRPTERFFDVKALYVPTFDGKYFHHTTISRHELLPEETFQVCLGQFSLETYRGESLQAFSFGGMLRAVLEQNDLCCDLTSDAPILKLQDDPGSGGGLLADELIELLAEKAARMKGHEDELYSRLARYSPYKVFLGCLVTLQERIESTPTNLRRDKYHKVAAMFEKAFNAVKEFDGWDGRSPGLDELISGGA